MCTYVRVTNSGGFYANRKAVAGRFHRPPWVTYFSFITSPARGGGGFPLFLNEWNESTDQPTEQALFVGTVALAEIGSIPHGTGPLDRLAFPHWCAHWGQGGGHNKNTVLE